MIGAALVAAGKERDEHERQIELLMREVAHRSRNLISVALSIIRRMPGDSVEVFRERLMGRLAGLSAGQDALLDNAWQAADLRLLVEKQISVFADATSSRVVIGGPPVQLNSHAAQAIGMALHELGTNAVKHGALSARTGQVSIKWRLDSDANGEERLVMAWQETGGTKVRRPSREGFGTTIIKRVPESSFGAEVDIGFGPEGLTWTFAVAAARVVQSAPDPADPGSAAPEMPTDLFG
jgi:two-component sensor histidine kinase